jgi:hypothetical protein
VNGLARVQSDALNDVNGLARVEAIQLIAPRVVAQRAAQRRLNGAIIEKEKGRQGKQEGRQGKQEGRQGKQEERQARVVCIQLSILRVLLNYSITLLLSSWHQDWESFLKSVLFTEDTSFGSNPC